MYVEIDKIICWILIMLFEFYGGVFGNFLEFGLNVFIMYVVYNYIDL